MNERRNLLQDALAAIERLQARLDAAERGRREPIAIVGAGCRYPGGIETLEAFWDVVRDGVDAVSDVPSSRWDADAYYDPDPRTPGKMVTRRAGLLTQVDRFDARFFGISPREAAALDPQQRLLLETAAEALEQAGLAADRLAGSATGVFVGITTSDYGQLLRQAGPERSDVYSATGSALNAAAGRISFTYGFQGPSVAVDTACSSSLVSVHLACQSLRSGESDLALAGGVNVILLPDAMVLFSKWGMMAPDGSCKTFDAAADGFVRAEGCAMLALKRLGDAQAAGDPILAVIRGSAVNSDGRSSGLTVPNGPAQEAVVRRALRDAGLAPADIDYVEAHGTGTPLGDPIEIEALARVMGAGRPTDRPLLIGSVKTNLGHTEAASGAAGLLKVVLALRHDAIPPHLHFTTPNPGIAWAELPLRVPTSLTAWPRGDRPRRAGVSSFGFSGTNAHVVIEEAPARIDAETPADTTQLVVLSARDDAALAENARRHAEFLDRRPGTALAEFAGTLARGRAHYERRAAFVSDTTADARATLAAIATGEDPPAVSRHALRILERPKVAFLFTGQGSQYAGMGRKLYESEPVFRAAIDRCGAILGGRLGQPLVDVLYPRAGVPSVLGETAVTQPALFALEYALAELWRSWGVTPSIVIGHSVGEYVAACVAGAVGLEEALPLIAERGRLMQELPPGGSMAALFAAEADIAGRIAGAGGRLSVAAVNGTEETVVSGDAEAIDLLLARCRADGIGARRLEVSHAFHSARLEPMLDAFEKAAARVGFRTPTVPLVSNLTGRLFESGSVPDAPYWRRHARQPVRFAQGLETLRTAGVHVLLEIGPHSTLLGLAARMFPNASWAAAASLRRSGDDRREMLAAAGVLYTRGAGLDWEAVSGPARRLALPTYAFQRERHWLAPAPRAPQAAAVAHPLLGREQQADAGSRSRVWESAIDLAAHPWIGDHRVQGAPIVPATAYIEMALAAGQAVHGQVALRVADIDIHKPLVLAEGITRLVQVTLDQEADHSLLRIRSRAAGEGSQQSEAGWTVHATARVEPVDHAAAIEETVQEVRGRCAGEVDGARFYASLAARGNQWGPTFQGLDHVWHSGGEAVGRVQVHPDLHETLDRYRFHPAVSDACGHALVAAIGAEGQEGATAGAFVGGGIGEVRFYQPPRSTTLWAHARVARDHHGPANVIVGDVRVFDDAGVLVSETRGARLWYLDESEAGRLLGAPDEWLYQVGWQPGPVVEGGSNVRPPAEGTWVVLADARGVGERIAALRREAGLRTLLVDAGTTWSSDSGRVTIRPDVADDYRRVLSLAKDPVVLLHLWSLDDRGAEDASTVTSRLHRATESVLHLVQAIPQARLPSPASLWLVTPGTRLVTSGDCVTAPWLAALWGLGKSLWAEHGELRGGLIDLAHEIDAARDAVRLIDEITHPGAETEIALRRHGRWVPRLERRVAPEAPSGPLHLRGDATYLVTGGLGGVGLEMGRWLAERGARCLLLVGRTPLPPRDAWATVDPGSPAGRRIAGIRAIEAAGAVVETRSLDVSDAADLHRCLGDWGASGHPPIRGVIHSAGILAFRPLDDERIDSLRAMLGGKALGAWHLHEALGPELDFFVMCSSTSTLLNSPLLGGYAAANAVLDALAAHRRSRGLSALSVNWGTWGQVGMAMEAGRGRDMLSGVGTIATARGLAALERLLEEGDVQAAVIPIEWAAFAEAYPAFAADPFFERLAGDAVGETPARIPPLSAGLLDPAGRPGALEDYLRREASRVLGMEPPRLDTGTALSSLGLDSLMAVQLKNRIQADLGATLPLIELLQGPSVEQLAGLLLEALGGALAVQEAGVTSEWEEGLL